MKKLQGITLQDWITAEQSMVQQTVQPEGSITVEQYAELRGLSLSRAGSILRGLLKAGRVRREDWNNGYHTWVYWLNK